MSEPTEFELLELATPYALNAVSDAERAAIDRQLAAAPASVAEAFREEARAVRETMTAVSPGWRMKQKYVRSCGMSASDRGQSSSVIGSP